MTRIFLSFLGTGNYSVVNYKFNGNTYSTKFAQVALIKEKCSNWDVNDKICIFVTDEVREHENFQSLQVELSELNGISPYFITVKAGKNETELWQIFNTVYETIEDGAEVYLDVTHGFRSLPMLGCYILNFAKTNKQITVGGIYYGAYEARNENDAPIFELTTFDKFFDLSIAVDSFHRSGDAKQLTEFLGEKTIDPEDLIAKFNGAKEKEVYEKFQLKKVIYNISRYISNFTKALAVCHTKEAKNSIQGIKRVLQIECSNDVKQELCKKHPENIIRFDIISKVIKDFDIFSEDDIKCNFDLSKWCYEHNLYQQAVTIAQETFITYILKPVSPFLANIQDEVKKRELISGAMQKFTRYKWDLVQIKDEEKEIFKNLYGFFEKNDIPVKVYDSLSKIRNDMNHAKESDHISDIRTRYETIGEVINTFIDFVSKRANNV